MPGQFFTLKFDFSRVNRSPDIDKAHRSLERTIASSFRAFYETYSTYLGVGEEELLHNIILEDPAESLLHCVRVVQKAISKLQYSGKDRLASTQGVRIELLCLVYC